MPIPRKRGPRRASERGLHRLPTPDEVTAAREILRSWWTQLGYAAPGPRPPVGALSAIARYLNISRETVSRWWTGKRRLSTDTPFLLPVVDGV